MSEITLQEQIEAVEFHAGIRSVPADYSSAHEYAALKAAAATLRELQKNRQISQHLREAGFTRRKKLVTPEDE